MPLIILIWYDILPNLFVMICIFYFYHLFILVFILVHGLFLFVYVIHHYSRFSRTFYQEYYDRVPSVIWLEDDVEIEFFHI